MQISGMRLYTENGWIDNGQLCIGNEKITHVGKENRANPVDGYRFPSGYKCLPGMIDVHIHGANGADTMDATEETLTTMAQALPAEGTTSFLATTITNEIKRIEDALVNAGNFMSVQQPGTAEVLGIHLEGPFINSKRAGAQPLAAIQPHDPETFDRWMKLSNHSIKIVTLAPELPGGTAFVQHIKQQGALPSIGHSNGTFEDTIAAIEAGATHLTHLFNGLPPLHHRKPGVIGAALMNDALFTEMIVDGVHISPEMVKLAFRLKGPERMILITDAIRAKGLTNGPYELGGQEVTVHDGKATLSDGTLAGSVLTMDQAWRNMIEFTGCTLEDIVQMGAMNPAKQCGVFDRKGSISEGKDADFIILNETNQVMMTICRGKVAYIRDKR